MLHDGSIEEILPDLYKIKIPLPGIPLPGVNAYLVKSQIRNLIVDPGMDHEQSFAVMRHALKRLSVDPGKTDLFCTHMHLDHLGLVLRLRADQAKIYLGERDVAHFEAEPGWDESLAFALSNGFPENELHRLAQEHPAYSFMKTFRALHLPFTVAREKETLRVGTYGFTVIETPGHADGHLCLYEAEEKLLISGDHILKEITPTVQLWFDRDNPLLEYLASLDKIERLDVKLVLPGHGPTFTDCRGRINELKEHRVERSSEILCLLKQGSQTAYGLASQMSWNIECDSWEKFPPVQRWFSTGETIAHLFYLKEEGLVQKNGSNGRIEFSLTPC